MGELSKWIPKTRFSVSDEDSIDIAHNFALCCYYTLQNVIGQAPSPRQLEVFAFTLIGCYTIYVILEQEGYNLVEFPLHKIVNFSGMYVIFDDIVDEGTGTKDAVIDEVGEMIKGEHHVPSLKLQNLHKCILELKEHTSAISLLYDSEVLAHSTEKVEPKTFDEDIFNRRHQISSYKSINSIRLLFDIICKVPEDLSCLSYNMGVVLQLIDDMADYEEDVQQGTYTQVYVHRNMYDDDDKLYSLIDVSLVTMPAPFRALFGMQHYFMFSDILDRHLRGITETGLSRVVTHIKREGCDCGVCNYIFQHDK